MADPHNHYESAFEVFVRRLRIPCIGVDETHRTWTDDESLKSMDYIVALPGGRCLLVDVKGRRLAGRGCRLENWATRDDVASLARWEKAFGSNARGLLVFVYEVSADECRTDFEDRFSVAERHYGCLAITVADYRDHLKVRSLRWQTVDVPSGRFVDIARPFSHWVSLTGHAA